MSFYEIKTLELNQKYYEKLIIFSKHHARIFTLDLLPFYNNLCHTHILSKAPISLNNNCLSKLVMRSIKKKKLFHRFQMITPATLVCYSFSCKVQNVCLYCDSYLHLRTPGAFLTGQNQTIRYTWQK